MQRGQGYLLFRVEERTSVASGDHSVRDIFWSGCICDACLAVAPRMLVLVSQGTEMKNLCTAGRGTVSPIVSGVHVWTNAFSSTIKTKLQVLDCRIVVQETRARHISSRKSGRAEEREPFWIPDSAYISMENSPLFCSSVKI